MRAETAQLLSELKSLEICSNLGSQSALPHKAVGSWSEALKLCRGKEWSALQLMTHNRNYGLVNELNWDRYQSWNPTVQGLRPDLALITQAAIGRSSGARKVPDYFGHSIRWDLLGILLEREFEDVKPAFFYLPRLLPIYRAGHFPCGWTGPKLDEYWSASREPIPPGDILIF
jgi:hypothetical protein